ncbi:hypothetical protein BDV33DRAFT_174636 [Aspergillus novoparasiticus]|uniref:Uncharacterized protein n=1 Tax=Aspergillus novoparasiticus TaxID=986946 RepID=A0A5N6ENR6_9EURO|nr:hypothetical protein BDV33DRAFT_174636 [Aspergillus novoparasiticus]
MLHERQPVKQKDNTGELAFEGDMQTENIYVEALDTKAKYSSWQWEYSKCEGVDLPVDTPRRK